MKTLNTTFEKRGFQYQQVLREGQVAIYSQTLNDRIIAYEVIKIKQAPAHERGGVQFPEMELYPSDEQFGLNGWSFGNYGDLSATYHKALTKFTQIKTQ